MIAHIYWVKRYCLRNGNKCGRVFFYELKFGMQIHQKKFDLGYDRGFFNRIIPPPKIPKLREIPIFALSFYFLRRGLQRKGAYVCHKRFWVFSILYILCPNFFPIVQILNDTSQNHWATSNWKDDIDNQNDIKVKAQGQTVFLR